MSNKVWALKLILIGDGRVGKTSLRRTFMGEKFEENYLNTIGADFSYKQIEIDDGIEVSVSIWDLAGQKTYEKVHPQYYAGASGVMVVYDITNEESFLNIRKWIDKYHLHSEYPDTPFLVIGNKLDLISEDQKLIDEKNLENLLEELRGENDNKISFNSILTSAKTGLGVDDAFSSLIKNIIAQRVPSYTQRISKEKPKSFVIPAAYLILFDDMYGPKIIARSPITLSESKAYSDKEFGSAIKISSVIDLDDVINHTQITGSFNWVVPEGTFHYIGFTRQDNDSNQLYLLGFVVKNSYEPLILEQKALVNGYLHNVMNQFVSEILTKSHDLTSVEIASTINMGKKDEFSSILKVLREYVFDLIIKTTN